MTFKTAFKKEAKMFGKKFGIKPLPKKVGVKIKKLSDIDKRKTKKLKPIYTKPKKNKKRRK